MDQLRPGRIDSAMLNWVVIGIGDITTKRVIPAIQAEARSRLYGIVTRDPAKGAHYKCKLWTDVSHALADPETHAVYIATPVFLHESQTIAGLRAGKDVLCEKPMAMDHAGASRMVHAAAETGRVLGIAYYRRRYPKLLRARQLLEHGAIGRPVLAEANCHYWFNDEDGRRGWLLDPRKAGGGPLYDIASHRIDALNFLFGQPARACGLLSSLVHHREVEDNATVLIDYENGVRGVVDVRWHSRVPRDGFRIIGTEGEMDLTPLSDPPLVHPGGREEIPCHPNVHFPCVENFVSAVLDGAALSSTGETALWTSWVTEQVLRAGSP